ncbi:hypothetical protein QYF36_020862 [Acer negundo]|nr:hypothetical protein QYF36_020862 [Acer negundo]
MVGPVPSPHLIKVNSAAYGIVFRSSGGDFIGCFAMKIGCNTSFFAELSAVIIEDGQCFGSKEERVIGRQQAPGACPYCGGMIQAMDVESQWRFCFVPFYFKTKRKFNCSVCAKRLVVQ